MAGVSDRLVRSLEKGGARGVGLENLAAVLSPLGLGLALTGVDGPEPRVPAIPDAQSLAYEALLLEAVESWRMGDDNG